MTVAAQAFDATSKPVDYCIVYDQLMEILRGGISIQNLDTAKALTMDLAIRAEHGDEDSPWGLQDVSMLIETCNAPSAPRYIHRHFISSFEEYTQAKAGDHGSLYCIAADIAENTVQKPLDNHTEKSADMDAIATARLFATCVARLSLSEGETTLEDTGNYGEFVAYLNPTIYYDAPPPTEHLFSDSDFDTLWEQAKTFMPPEQVREIVLQDIYQKNFAPHTGEEGQHYPETTWPQIGKWLCMGLDHMANRYRLAPDAVPTNEGKLDAAL